MAPPKRWRYRGRLLSHAEAVALQERERERRIERWSGPEPRNVAGVDISIRADRARAALVVLQLPDFTLLETATAERDVEFPYLPGLLAFREVPSILDAFEKLSTVPDLLMVDGHGKAHPRRFGVACHVGVELDLPAIGIGKTRLVGEHREPAEKRGSATRLVHDGEVIGRVVRTRDGVSPVFVSIGHRTDLETAVRLALACAGRYRLPEPIRAAHRAAGEPFDSDRRTRARGTRAGVERSGGRGR